MDLSTVKAITIPEGSVKKITDSNGNTLWGDPTAFPYRRLEYIQSSGTQAIDTDVACARNSYMKLYVEDLNSPDAPQGRGAVTNAQRFGAGYKSGNYFFGLGNAWITGNTATSGPHMLGVQGPECHILDHKIWGSGGQQGYLVDSTFTNNSNTFPSNITWYSVYLLGSRGDAAGSIQQPIYCKLHYAELGYSHTSTYNIGYNRRMYPVQRKSDGKLGFYDIVGNQFYSDLVSGSDSDTLTAGPVINEYFDTTVDPSVKQTYTNSNGFVVPKNNVVNETTTIMTLDEDIDYITISAHLYHQDASSADNAYIEVTSLFSAGGTNKAVNNTTKTAQTVNISDYRLQLDHSGTICNVYVSDGLGTTSWVKAYVRLNYDKTTRTITAERYGQSGVGVRVEMTNLTIKAHTAY